MSNTGLPACAPLINVARKIILTPTFDSTGARNKIVLADIDEDYFDEQVNAADSSQRWYPLPNVVDVEDKRGDAIMQELSNRSKIFVADGTRTFSGMIWGRDGSTILKGIIDTARCSKFSAYVVDKKGNLIVGEVSDDGTEAYPFLLESDSVVGTPIYATDNTVQGMKLTFDFSQDQDDACIRMIQSSDLAGVDLLLLEGLRDVFNAQSILSVTGFVIQFYTKGIEAGKKIPVEGLVITDFISTVGGATSKVRQTNNTPADIAITSVTEGTGANAGKYTIVLPTQTTGDSIDVLVTKAGFSFTAETVVIP
jgi:hypothetical protein